MKCFIHDERDAQGVCTKCGRAMCKNCMKFAEYSGLCPNCFKKSLEKRCLGCVIQMIILLPIIFNYPDFLNFLSSLSYNIANFINNYASSMILFCCLIFWALIVLIVLISTIVNISIINKSEKTAKATLLKEKNEKVDFEQENKIKIEENNNIDSETETQILKN